jgi:DNA-binding CsgD family transcriptional regulator
MWRDYSTSLKPAPRTGSKPYRLARHCDNRRRYPTRTSSDRIFITKQFARKAASTQLSPPLFGCLGNLTVGRELGSEDFSDADLDAAKLIVPHLKTALEVQGRLDAADLRARGALDVVAQLNIGVILLDTAMRPVLVNPCAEAIAARRDGLLLTRQTVVASRPSDTEDLRRAMAAAASWHHVSRDSREMAIRPGLSMRCCLSRQPPRPPLIVSVMPMCRAGIPGEQRFAACVALFVADPDRAAGIDPGVLVKTFQLTRREAALACMLAGGMDLADAASKLGIGIGTARGYLKQILAKTYTHRQAELVALLLRTSTEPTQAS